MNGSTYKRCRCRDERGRALEANCPQLRRKDGSWNPRHGRWYFWVDVTVVDGASAKRVKRGGYVKQTDAEEVRDAVALLFTIPDAGVVGDQARNEILLAVNKALDAKTALPDYDETRRRYQSGQVINATMTVGQWLDEWIKGRRKLAKGTIRSYEAHIRLYLRPHLGNIPIDRLRVVHISTMFDAIDADNEFILNARTSGDLVQRRAVKGRRIVGSATKQRIRATLRSALTTAIKQEQVITVNHAKYVELEDSGKPPKALMWTDEYVEAWKENRRERNLVALDLDAARERRDHSMIARLEAQLDKLDEAERPSPVMVWTPEQTGEFLDGIQKDRLYPFFHLIAYRGTRRGETCGARWVDLNRAKSSLKVSEQLVQLGWKVESGKPKSDAGDRTIGLDDVTNDVLETWRKTQIAEQLAHGPGWIRSGRIFTRPDGSELHPADITRYFNQLVASLGLPPIRLHDLRHGAATRALEAEVDIKIVQELLGHSTSTLTRDTYTSVSPRLAKEAAEKAAKMVPRKAS